MPTVYHTSGYDAHACNCIGPQNGQPRCPCLMRGVKVIDGRYVQILDLGPVREILNLDCVAISGCKTATPKRMS